MTGESRWTNPPREVVLPRSAATKLYLRSYNLDLFMMDRKTGRMLVDPGETHLRAGLNLREYDLDIVNRFNDRMYFATSSGMIVCMREKGQPQPRLLKDPKAHPFGYVPPEGLKPTPPDSARGRAGARAEERAAAGTRPDDAAAGAEQGKGAG